MTVYVDNMRRRARVGRINARWSHLMADTHTELEEFARRLGLAPVWLQHAGDHLEHYDVTDTVRAQAVKMGAQPMKYGRESGLYTMWRAAVMRGDTEDAKRLYGAFLWEHARNWDDLDLFTAGSLPQSGHDS